ncbi:hypothetical protein [Methylobacterium sp. J-090]|uniref:hypothetical protein n=1 Tax=Methylobacterium sp. J-090 TaxID=2836666 RepID=UPI001FB8CBFE|nr:hypothetical protein [Methylobacterium sp. J-090]MCJ2081211.1 hypothetical protein [Methylobacterium sp. J-090]
MNAADRDLEMSPLGGAISRDGLTVKVYIYRFAGTADTWTLEVVDREGCSTVWELRFPDDLEAYEAFERAIAEDGIRSFSDNEPVGH